ncbi:hypothetical protein QJS04_geneDACA007493 [Acorus gramineus]|uniref:JmjC domain-containing protein n=1 Tax=Acorus gramineus TaxID=55184 RepID=A0AAV9B5A8_ACOGR|nr:hypothetical protein QJS04_geneDACA007493 [Acorus gramineus]
MDRAPEIIRFDPGPSFPDDFPSSVEPKNVPTVFHGAVKDWIAISKWDPHNGGLDYLQDRVRSATVEAMLSRTPPVFYGDLRSHERVPLPFSTFVSFCKNVLQNVASDASTSGRQETDAMDSDDKCSVLEVPLNGVYLAQVPILNMENKERSPLEVLKDDIQMPMFLDRRPLASINLWMNSVRSRSSTHYDPHHNILCIVAGCKQVVLWPPSASPLLYPMAIYGEASNHSAVDIAKPDFSAHPRAKHFMDHSQRVVLNAGDALFIPEGWFHQVDSDDLTIAVNFWWPSDIMSSMSEHMDAYYLRRILNRLVGLEMNKLLPVPSRKSAENALHQSANRMREGCHDHNSDEMTCSYNLKGNNEMKVSVLHELEPKEHQALHELVSLVHETISVASQCHMAPSNLIEDTKSDAKCESEKLVTSNSRHPEDDYVASILWNLDPLNLRNVLVAMMNNFPRTLEALILHALSPVGAEVLTRKFDQMDQQTSKEKQSEFYQLFYDVFDDQFAAMEAILNGKETFAFQAFRNVMDQYLGVNICRPK